MRLDSKFALGGDVYLGQNECAGAAGPGGSPPSEIVSTVSGAVALVDPTATGSCGQAIHTDTAGDWSSDLTLSAAAISDPGGPFDGAYYVAGHTLKVRRMELLNAEFFPGSAAYIQNVAAHHINDLRELRASTTAHEAAHTTLIWKTLSDVDPTPILERLVARDATALAIAANHVIASANDALTDPAGEALVEAVLASINQSWATDYPTIMMRSGTSWVPDTFQTTYATTGEGG